VRSGDAIVFLAGANLGAAAYEYALGRLTRLPSPAVASGSDSRARRATRLGPPARAVVVTFG